MNLNGKEYRANVCKYCGTALGRDNNICSWCHRAQDEGADSEIDNIIHNNRSSNINEQSKHKHTKSNASNEIRDRVEGSNNSNNAGCLGGCCLGGCLTFFLVPIVLLIVFGVAYRTVDIAGENSRQYLEESINAGAEYNEVYDADSDEEKPVITDSSSNKVYDSYAEVIDDLYMDIALGHRNLDDVYNVNEQGENYDTVFAYIVNTALSRIESRSYIEFTVEGEYDPEYVERAFNELDQYNTFGRLALAKALTILDEEDCSEALLREYIIGIYEFTEEDCEFALAHLNVDFHQEALDYAKYLESTGYNKGEIREELELYQFNENQIQYALDNIS